VAVTPLSEGELTLEQAASHYVQNVHRLRPGDRFVAFDPQSRTQADAEIVGCAAAAVRCRMSKMTVMPERTSRVSLIYALAKGDKLDVVVRDATALGVDEIVLTSTERSIVQLAGDRAERRVARLKTVAVESARQCQRGDIPCVVGPLSLQEALEHAAAHAGERWCLHPDGPISAGQALVQWSPQRRLAVLIGPEGGFSNAELELAQRYGFRVVALGQLVLRTETAVAAVLGAIVCHATALATPTENDAAPG
jgi:16S rRNA (uracil1498-N3)-methyltransferase